MSAPHSTKRRHQKPLHNPKETCPVCRKIRYRSRKIALTMMNRLRAPDSRAGRVSVPTAVYHCSDCGDWHLTSREQTT